MEHNFEMKTGLDTAAMDSATVDKRPKQWHPLPQFNKTKEKSYLWARYANKKSAMVFFVLPF